jgi:hypothetical protein
MLVKNEEAKVEALLNKDKIMRVVHTLWQAAGGALITDLLANHSAGGIKLALTAAFAAALSALKNLYVAKTSSTK